MDDPRFGALLQTYSALSSLVKDEIASNASEDTPQVVLGNLGAGLGVVLAKEGPRAELVEGISTVVVDWSRVHGEDVVEETTMAMVRKLADVEEA